MRLKLYNEADAVFIYFKEIFSCEVEKTISLDGNINIDLDKDRKILGMEILNASKVMPKQEIL